MDVRNIEEIVLIAVRAFAPHFAEPHRPHELMVFLARIRGALDDRTELHAFERACDLRRVRALGFVHRRDEAIHRDVAERASRARSGVVEFGVVAYERIIGRDEVDFLPNFLASD